MAKSENWQPWRMRLRLRTAYFAGDYPVLLQNPRGDIAFQSGLCCKRFPEGIFLSPAPGLVANGGFELPGDNGLPAGWQIVWHESGTGDAFRYERLALAYRCRRRFDFRSLG